MKKVFYFILIFCGCSGQANLRKPAENTATKATKIEVERNLLKDMALCSCVVIAYPGKIDDISSSEIIQRTHYSDFSLPRRLNDFIRKWLSKEEKLYLPPFSEGNMVIWKCLEFYKSEELNQFVKEQDKYIMEEK